MNPDNCNLLFVGAYLPANIEAVKWIRGKLMNKIRGRVTVIGTGMDKLQYLECQRLKIGGRVEDLKPYYAAADVVILPIFRGAGMCTKTVEALFYKKPIIGTRLALRGLPMPYPSGIYICEKIEEWQAVLSNPDVFNSNGDELEQYYKKYLTFESKVTSFQRIFMRELNK